MAALIGDTGKVAYGTLKTFSITPATPREPDFTPITSLPTAQTAGLGYSFTVEESDLPTITPEVTTKYVALFVVAGKNLSGASASVTASPFKNTVSTGANGAVTVTNGNFWTITMYRFFDVTVGDVLDMQVWANVANVSLDYAGLMIFPTQMQFTKDGIGLKDVSLSNFIGPALTKGVAPLVINTQNYNFYISAGHAFNSTGVIVTLPWLPSLNGLNLGWRAAIGDVTQSNNGAQSATNQPGYSVIKVPGTITFREVLR